MAMQRGESPRRVRARLEKMGLLENLEAQIAEAQKRFNVVLNKAVFEDTPVKSARPSGRRRGGWNYRFAVTRSCPLLKRPKRAEYQPASQQQSDRAPDSRTNAGSAFSSAQNFRGDAVFRAFQ